MQNLLVAMINAQNHSQMKEVKSKSFRFGDEDINWFQSMISLDDLSISTLCILILPSSNKYGINSYQQL